MKKLSRVTASPFQLFNEFKMLVVLARGPIATPVEAGLGEELEAEVVVVYLVGKVPVAVAICLSRGGLDEERTILANLIIWVIQRVDVDGQSAGVLRQIGGASDIAVAEARRVVVAHLCLIISVIDIWQQHALDGVLRIEELAQDTCHTVGYLLVAHHLANVHLVIVIPVQGSDMAQVVTADIGVLLVGLALHALPYAVGDGVCSEALVNAPVGRNGLGADGLSSLPLRKRRRVWCRVIVAVAARRQHVYAAEDHGDGKHPVQNLFHCLKDVINCLPVI